MELAIFGGEIGSITCSDLGTPFACLGRMRLRWTRDTWSLNYVAHMIFFDRSHRDPDPYVRVKTMLFVIGAALGLVGMRLESGWMVGAAMAILLVAVGLRLLAVRSRK